MVTIVLAQSEATALVLYVPPSPSICTELVQFVSPSPQYGQDDSPPPKFDESNNKMTETLFNTESLVEDSLCEN